MEISTGAGSAWVHSTNLFYTYSHATEFCCSLLFKKRNNFFFTCHTRTGHTVRSEFIQKCFDLGLLDFLFPLSTADHGKKTHATRL